MIGKNDKELFLLGLQMVMQKYVTTFDDTNVLMQFMHQLNNDMVIGDATWKEATRLIAEKQRSI